MTTDFIEYMPSWQYNTLYGQRSPGFEKFDDFESIAQKIEKPFYSSGVYITWSKVNVNKVNITAMKVEKEKKWLISENKEGKLSVRYIYQVIKKGSGYDDGYDYYAMVMKSGYETHDKPSEMSSEFLYISKKDMFETKREAQTEILYRERFGG